MRLAGVADEEAEVTGSGTGVTALAELAAGVGTELDTVDTVG